jgi:hypothetical protein
MSKPQPLMMVSLLHIVEGNYSNSWKCILVTSLNLVRVSPNPIIRMNFVLQHLDKKIAHVYVHLNWLIKHSFMAILMVVSP